MEIIRGVQNIKAYHCGCALTIGNFDGVHRGHQFLLKNLKFKGKQLTIPTIVMIFEPQPLEFFTSNKKIPARLTHLRDKIKYFSEINIDYLLFIEFNKYIASLTPFDFISKLLVNKLDIKHLIIGDDFKFGRNRMGDFEFLKYASEIFGFKVTNTKSIYNIKTRISSTVIRKAIQENNFILAENLLGHPYRISGRVIYGNQIGKKIGFPTANLLLKHLVVPVDGVYIVEVHDGFNKKALPGVANIGKRPTLPVKKTQLEVHLIDENINLYGHYIDVVLRKKLRDEQKFTSLKYLKKQITKDVTMAKEYFYKIKN
ncbi:Riboflavin biosynthesis protein RibF [Candidatus Providencia siddallii]|uniref:Riboflavin biosynthesis protein n=1 Tax=Candidatus Providencia siddallii TaxID=1715285 RepID=A0A0M6W6N5_9GAMM|nr:Riboflavin biosynthesis protein RibF [Candidatus Providencia siddallii]